MARAGNNVLGPLVKNGAVIFALSLASCRVVTSTTMQTIITYSDTNCQGTPLRLSMNANESCTSERSLCDTLEANGGVTYRSTSCINVDRHGYVAGVFEGFSYVMMDVYKEKGCETLDFTAAFLATGTCSTASYNTSAIIMLNSTGSAQIRTFLGITCGGDIVISLYPTEEEIADHSCVQDMYKFYSSISEAPTSGSSSSSSDGIATATPIPAAMEVSNSSTGLSAGDLAGITIGGVFFVLIVTGLIAWWCLTKRQRYPSESVASPIDHEGSDIKAGYSCVSDATERGTMANVQIPRDSSLPQRGSFLNGGLWDDETIVAVRIPRRKVIIQQLISHDGYADVFKGTFNGHLVSIKSLSFERQRDPESVLDFGTEVKMMAAMDHPRIARLIGVAWESRADLCAVSEYLDGGDLRTLLVQFTKLRHPVGFDYDKVKIALHVAHALTYLHSLEPPVIHRNLKSKNILLSSDLDAKLTDFGVSRMRIDCSMTSGVGSTLWMAPEVVMGRNYDDKADIFSFGVVLSELDVQSLPYSHSDAYDNSGHKKPDTMILRQVAAGELRVDFSQSGSRSMRELGMACVSVDPNHRPTAAEVLYKLHTILNREM